jgi:hypothetical protein
MKKEVLSRPFTPEQIRTRPGQNGKTIAYVETHAVITRLNDAADFAWSFELVNHQVLADEVIVLGKLTIDGIAKMAFGGSTVTRDAKGKDVSLADDLKSAASDATKKCASLFGVGLELYGAGPQTQAPAREEQAPPSRVEDRLTSRQLSAIHAACRRKGWGREQLASLVDARFGANNAHVLTRAQASQLLSELSGLNGH